MSLTRRLRRLLRAQLGSLRAPSGDEPSRTDDPFRDPDPFRESDPDADADAQSTTSTDPSSPDVPPDVAKAYRALEIPVGSDRDTVKTAYRRMMNKYHQDRFDNDDEKREIAGTVSKRLNLAYDRILEYLDRQER